MTRGLILFAHGARDPRWASPFEEIARRVTQREPGVLVRLAFLEFMAPTLQQAGDALSAAGCSQVDVLPLFLGTGGHVRKDLPVLLAELGAAHPLVRWQLQPAIGEFDSVVAAMAEAASQLLGKP
jgi:sirohydrochlorin cobaltochelatase